MTDNNHPMLPTQEQLTEWDSERFDEGENFDAMMIKAFQAGADQELEACCEWLDEVGPSAIPLWGFDLRKDRRPKPPSLKEQGLKALDSFEGFTGSLEEVDIIRRALEALPD